MGGGKGGSSGVVKTQISPLEQQLANVSKELMDTTAGLRSGLINKYNNYLSGNYDYQADPTYQGLFSTYKSGLESQYQNAKENLLSNMSGGALTRNLGQLETARASDVGRMPGQITQDIANQIMGQTYGTAWQTPGTAVGALSSANNSYGNRLSAQMMSEASGKGGLGAGLGSLAGQLGSAWIMKS